MQMYVDDIKDTARHMFDNWVYLLSYRVVQGVYTR